MKKNFLFKNLIIYFFICTSVYSQETITNKIAPGIIHYEINTTEDTLIINILDIYTDSCNCYLNTLKANDKINSLETTSSMAEGDSIIAAVNADFFEADGSTINNIISDGDIIKALSEAPYDRGGVTYSQIAFDEMNNPYIEKFKFRGKLKTGKSEFSLYGINTPLRDDELILYNHFYDMKDIPKEKLLLLNNNDLPEEYIPKEYKDEDFSDGDFILYNGKGIELSEKVSFSFQFEPDLRNIRMLSGGWPQIIKNGWVCLPETEISERVFRSFKETKHPRTGIGFSKDSTHIFLFVVDGRQSKSRGISLDKFAEQMLNFGVYNAINLDGGGSSTMVINGKVVNNPSDKTGERKVGSAITVVKKR